MSTRIRRAMAAAVVTCTFALMGLGQMNSAQAEETPMLGDHRVPAGGGDQGLDHGAGPFDGAILAVGLLGNLVNHSSKKESDSPYRKDCITVGNCNASLSYGPSTPLLAPELEIRKKAPLPIGT